MAPAVAYGASGERAGFAGTLSIGHEVLADLLVELVRSARGAFAGVVFVCAHGGNADGLRAARARAAPPRATRLVWRRRVAGGDAHAGRTETSLMLAIGPAAVRLERPRPGARIRWPNCGRGALKSGGVAAVSANGVLGDPDRRVRRWRPATAGSLDGRDLVTTVAGVAMTAPARPDEWRS